MWLPRRLPPVAAAACAGGLLVLAEALHRRLARCPDTDSLALLPKVRQRRW